MEGVVKSYVAEKRYGFIDGADGKSYFFHANGFTPKLEDNAVLDGALVTFDPTPTPKGLAAKRLQLARSQAVEWRSPAQFLMLRQDLPKRGRLVAEVDAVTVSGRESPDDLRVQLRHIAADMGANALVGVSYTKSTGSEGNYQFTIHHISGRPAVIMEPRVTSDLAAVTESERNCEARAAALGRGYEAYLAHLAELARMRRRKIIRNWLIGLTVVGGLVVRLLFKAN